MDAQSNAMPSCLPDSCAGFEIYEGVPEEEPSKPHICHRLDGSPERQL